MKPGKWGKASKQPGGQAAFAGPPPKRAGQLELYVGNLAYDLEEESLASALGGAEAIRAVRWGLDKDTQEFRGFAHVEFVDDRGLEAARRMDGQGLKGRPMKISYATPRRTPPGAGAAGAAVARSAPGDCIA